MAVKPVLLKLYERYYLPLQRALLPSLQAFITGLLPGLEEGLEVYDRYIVHEACQDVKNNLFIQISLTVFAKPVTKISSKLWRTLTAEFGFTHF